MTTPDMKPVARVKPLEQQNSDFTSEGSPPPGMVARRPPVAAEEGAVISPEEKTLKQARPKPLDKPNTHQ